MADSTIIEVRVLTKSARKSLDKLKNKGNIVERDLERIGGKKGLGRVSKDAGIAGQAIGGLRNKVVSLRNVMIGGVFSLIVGQSAAFADSLLEVSTLVDTTTFSMSDLSEEAKKQAGLFGNLQAQPKAYYQIISAGAKSASDATNTLTSANKLAVGGVTDITTASDGLTSVLNAYGDKVEGATAVSDAMFVSMKAGKTTIAELSAGIGKVAPLASQAGVDFDELLSAVSALTKGGISTTESMTGLRAIMASVVKPTKDAENQAKALGIEFNSAGLESKGLAGFLEDVRIKTGGNTDAMAKLFGGVEALVPVLALTGGASISFSDTLEEMKNKAGATDEAFEKMAKSPIFQGKRLIAGVQAEFISLGQTLLVVAVPAMKFMADNMSLLTPAVGLLATVLLARLAPSLLLTGKRVVLNTVFYASYALSLGVATLASNAMVIATRGIGIAMAFVGGPIGLIVIALAGLTAWFFNSRSEADKLKNTILLSNGVHATHGDILNKVNGISSEYVMATKDRRAEIKGEVQDLILNSKALLENQMAVLGSLKARRYAYLNDPTKRRERTRGSGSVKKRKTLEFNESIKEQQKVISEASKSLSTLESKYDELGKTVAPTTTKIYGLNGSIDGTTGAGDKAKGSIENLTTAMSKINKELGKERNELGLTNIELYEYELRSKVVGKSKEGLTESFIKSAVAFKAETLAISDNNKKQKEKELITKSALESIKEYWATEERGFAIIKGLTAVETKRELIKRKTHLLNKKVIKETGKGLKFIKLVTVAFKDEKKAVEKSRLVLEGYTKAQARNAIELANSSRQLIDYTNKTDELSDKIKSKTILLEKGVEAQRLHDLAQEYGNKKRAEEIRGMELQDIAIDRNINSVNSMRDAILEMANDGENGLRSLFDAFGKSISTDGINGAIGNLKKGMSGLFSSDPAKGGGFGNVFTTGFDTIKNFKLSENGNHGEEYGGAAGKIIGAYWSPIGSAVGEFLGKFIGGFFADDPRAQLGTVTQANENIGAGGSKDGFYRNRFADGRNFYRDTDFGRVGFISGETKNVRGEATEQSMQFLDAMKSLYDTTASFLDENTIAKAKDNLSKKGVEALDPEKGIVEQYKIIIDSMSVDLKSLYKDTGDSYDELAQRAGQIAITAEAGVPYFKSLNLNMGKTNDSALANTVRFADLAGGLNNLLGASSHYYDVVSTDAEKLDYQREQSQLAIADYNKELGLTGTASINSLSGLKMYTAGLDLTTEAGREAALSSYAVVDSFNAIAKQDEARSAIIKSYHDAGLSANVGLEALKGGIDGLLPSVANYTSKFSDANQEMIKQGKYAQDIISVGNEFNIDPAQLDSFAELQVQVEKFKTNPDAVEALLGLADASDYIGGSGLSAVNALAGVDKSLLNIVGGVQTLEVGTVKSVDSMIASNDSLAESADQTNESINGLSGSLGSFTSTANESALLLRKLVDDGQKQLQLSREQSAEITRLRAETEEANKEAAIARDNALYLEEKAQQVQEEVA